MARIRTIKPEFWNSPSTARASAVARLTFIGMWNWADDAGRGTANPKELEGFIFPNDDIEELSGGRCRNFRSVLAEVSDAFGVLFYEVHGRPYYAIPSWSDHQRNERVAQGKHPGPDEADRPPTSGFPPDGGTSDTFRPPVAELPTTSGPGTGEQGNIGTGEQGNDRTLALIDPIEAEVSIDAAFDQWWEHVHRKVSKPAAHTAFARAMKKIGAPRAAALHMLTTAIEEHQRHWIELEGRAVNKIPHPATWLNDERWNDTLPPDAAYQGRGTAPAAESPTERIARMRNAAFAQMNGGDTNGNDRRMPRSIDSARVS